MLFETSLVTILRLLPRANDLELVELFLSKLPRIPDGLMKLFVNIIDAVGCDKLENSLVHLLNIDDFCYLKTSCKLVRVKN